MPTDRIPMSQLSEDQTRYSIQTEALHKKSVWLIRATTIAAS